ncbi:hypothetical protein L1987_85861 [Smallanthus sonchifolius]|uniref:Uncharacterized protein n=1 Tax=Smallanthus sonchifolius TaxID=185202 RepID=A0ACB8XXQ7_9ASTR|nr:hypothetical protein L1987_85861 [Smallanthus sonchifolius]
MGFTSSVFSDERLFQNGELRNEDLKYFMEMILMEMENHSNQELILLPFLDVNCTVNVTMVNPIRPRFVLFGSSIVQLSFALDGWGAILATIYSRKADIFLRGYSGWTSRQAVRVLDQVFPRDEAVQPSLVLVYFGGNDSVLPHPEGLNPHVSLPEYVENMRTIATHLQSLSEKTRVVFLTAPPINEAQLLEVLGIEDHDNEHRQKYADACVELCQEIGIKCIDLFHAFSEHDDWMETAFTDGMHLSAAGSRIVAREILKVLKEAQWEPSLHWEALPSEFA